MCAAENSAESTPRRRLSPLTAAAVFGPKRSSTWLSDSRPRSRSAFDRPTTSGPLVPRVRSRYIGCSVASAITPEPLTVATSRPDAATSPLIKSTEVTTPAAPGHNSSVGSDQISNTSAGSANELLDFTGAITTASAGASDSTGDAGAFSTATQTVTEATPTTHTTDSHNNVVRTLLAYPANQIAQREQTAITKDRACSWPSRHSPLQQRDRVLTERLAKSRHRTRQRPNSRVPNHRDA